MIKAYPPDYKTMAPIMILIGAVFFGVGAYLVGGKILELADTVDAVVTVADVEHKERRKGGFTYRPVFEITQANGTPLRYAGDLWSYPPIHEKGEVVSGRYSPSSGMIESNKYIRHQLMFGSIFTLVGAVLFFFGIHFSRKELQPSP